MIHSISEAFLNKQAYSNFFSLANFFSSSSKKYETQSLYIYPSSNHLTLEQHHSSSRTTLRTSHFEQINKYNSSDSFQIRAQNHWTSVFNQPIQITVPNHQASLFSNRIHNESSPSRSRELCTLKLLPGFWAQYTCKGWRDVPELQSQLTSTPFPTKSIAEEKFTDTVFFSTGV